MISTHERANGLLVARYEKKGCIIGAENHLRVAKILMRDVTLHCLDEHSYITTHYVDEK